MKKIKTENKYFLPIVFILSILVFIFFVLYSYLISLINISPTINLILVYLFSLFLSFLITLIIYVGSSTISDAMFTMRRMLRLENLSNPLLLRLSTEAPGTYHHSLNVSNLAQRAAKSIGADSLLVRIAAYYHDIGKLQNPVAFIENQSDDEIPSDENAESIRKNSEIIISHVKNGLKIAKESNIPEEIIDLIAEHHGTSRALYFYERAKERKLKIKQTDFRYLGPKPQTKESAILMLSDCIEASARSEQNLTKERINQIVENTFDDKFKENQISSSLLDPSEIAKIKQSLAETLRAIYHQRISYKNNEN